MLQLAPPSTGVTDHDSGVGTAPPGGRRPSDRAPNAREEIVEARDGVLDAVGRTPLIRLRRYLDVADVRLYIKWESSNPGGSAKDRPAREMIEDALRRGVIRRGDTVVESSSGNMGIGLAQACRYHGLRFVCVVDPHAQPTNLKIIEALGGRIERVTTKINDSYLNARIARVRQLLDADDRMFWTNQYANVANPAAHLRGTAREIDEAFGGEVDALFVATSSTGTVRGCRDWFRRRGRRTRICPVDAEGSVLFGGEMGPRHISGFGAGRVTELSRGLRFNDLSRVGDIDCIIGCRRCASREALLIGGSGGGVLEAVRRRQEELSGRNVVAILHDHGSRYLDTVYDDAWVRDTLGFTYVGDRTDGGDPVAGTPPIERDAVVVRPAADDEPGVRSQRRRAS